MIVHKTIEVALNIWETKTCEEMATIIEDIIDKMKENNCNQMYSMHTGECVSLSEFRRVLGIITGLTNMTEIYHIDYPQTEDGECMFEYDFWDEKED